MDLSLRVCPAQKRVCLFVFSGAVGFSQLVLCTFSRLSFF